jgi:hypothetical protein
MKRETFSFIPLWLGKLINTNIYVLKEVPEELRGGRLQ